MHIQDVAVFAAIAESQSLSAAARRLALSPMAVSRRLASLERELAVRLVQRTTRSVSLTVEGEAFLPYARTLLEANEAARFALKADAGSASGTLKVTAPTVLGQSIIMPLIPILLAKHPRLQIDLTLSDGIVDIVGQGIDVAIRVATLQNSGLVARALAANPRMLCASPAYLERFGMPPTVAALGEHRCITLHGMPSWRFTRDDQPLGFRPEGVFSANSVEAVRTASKQGLGIAMLTYWDIRDDLEAGSLVRIEPEDATPELLFISAVLPTRRQVPSRVRVFLAHLEERLGL